MDIGKDSVKDDDEDYINGQSPGAETQSAPGDLAQLPGTSSKESLDFPLGQPIISNTPVNNDNLFNKDIISSYRSPGPNTSRITPRPKGHYRGTRENGFASGPPFPTTPRREATWLSPEERQKKVQQIELIQKQFDNITKEAQCGIKDWRPKWIQRFANRKVMLILLCWFCTLQGMLINGLVPSSLSTIERRFQINTSTIGRIMQFYDFGYVLFCIPVSYFGGRHSKPLVLGIGLLCMAIGSFIFSSPHLITDAYTSTYNSEDAALSKCSSENSSSFLNMINEQDTINGTNLMHSPDALALKSCPSPENQPGTFRYVFLFCLAHFLHGVGATPLFTIGVSYIDENVGTALSSLYVGIFYSFAIFGPALGFITSSSFLQYHTDFLQPGQAFAIKNLDESDPKWVGAWWVGFQLASILMLVAVFPIISLPKVLPESLQWHKNRLQEEALAGGQRKRTPECCGVPTSGKTAAVFGSLMQMDETSASNVLAEQMPALKSKNGPIWYQLWLDVRHIPIAIYRILSNGSYMLITLAMAVDGMVIAGASTFMSKYLEGQFSVAPSKANMLIGVIMVPMAGIGTMASGYIIQHYKFNCVKSLKFCIALLLASLLLTPMFFIYCDHDQLTGVERPYMDKNDKVFLNITLNDDLLPMSLRSTCNNHCQCLDSEYHPICAEMKNESQIPFYSPCFAGCEEKYDPQRKFYTNCKCVPQDVKQVKKGYCESKCTGLFAFLTFFAPFCLFTFAVGVPLISVVLRTVEYAERSFALGIQWIIVRVVGTIPAPVVFGWIFDVSCTRQHLDPCSGEHGSCMLYQNKLLADLFFVFSIIGQLITMVLLISVLIFFAGSMRDDPDPNVINQKTDIPSLLNDDDEKKDQPSEIVPMLISNDG
uniref:Solute carrier organic anion transporter family member n=1 Tax=Strongyloides venezuelensis TaxID=75913 RepID=A0A0K0FEW5_STRVS